MREENEGSRNVEKDQDLRELADHKSQATNAVEVEQAARTTYDADARKRKTGPEDAGLAGPTEDVTANSWRFGLHSSGRTAGARERGKAGVCG